MKSAALGRFSRNLIDHLLVNAIKVTSTLVFQDVTVVDKKGRPVVSGLTKDDFTITEDIKPQRFSPLKPEAM